MKTEFSCQRREMLLFLTTNMAAMQTSQGSFKNEALENEDRSTKHPNLENEAP